MDSNAIEYALSLILKEPFFIDNPESKTFLSYVVSTTLKGDARRLKAYDIAVNALGKSDSFDPLNDPTVRTMAYKIRAELDRYNAKPNAAAIAITMEIGSYEPIFTKKSSEKS